MTPKLENKVVVITGASSGIGEATALRLSREGASLVIAARRKDRLDRLETLIRKEGGQVMAVVTDVTKQREVQNLIEAAVKRLGKVDVMINNAGIAQSAPTTKVQVQEWDQMIDVNIKGVLYGIAAVLPHFQKQGGGHIVNLSSVAGRRIYAGATVYCATKFAVRAISEGLRAELDPRDKIRVTVIEPGAVKTEFVHSVKDEQTRKRLADWLSTITPLEPEDVAEGIAYALIQPLRVNVDEVLIMPSEQGA